MFEINISFPDIFISESNVVCIVVDSKLQQKQLGYLLNSYVTF